MSLLTPTGNTQRDISNRQAVFKTLSYSTLFDDQITINKINSSETPDRDKTYGSLFYELDSNGNLIPDGNGAYKLKPEVKKDAFISDYLNKNSNLATDLLNYKIDRVVHSDDGLVATAVVDSKYPETAYLTARGSTADTFDHFWDDWATTNTELAANEYVSNFEIAQVVDFENFIDQVQDLYNYETINPGGHSKAGYLTQMGTAYILANYKDVKVGQADSFNGPVATRAIELRYGEEYVQKTLAVTNLHMTTGDLVSEIGNVLGNVDGKFLIYNSISDNPTSHTSLSFSELDMSTFYTDYFEGGVYAVDQYGNSIYGEPIVNVEKWTQDYAKILSYEDQVHTQIDNMGSNDSGVDVLIVRAEGYLQGTIDTATFGLVSFGPYAELDNIKNSKQHMENLLKGVDGIPTIENNALATIKYIEDSLGGQENLELLNSIADVVFNGLDSKPIQSGIDNIVKIGTSLFQSAENLDSSSKQNFIASLKDNSFIKDIIDSTFDTGAEDALVDIALDIAEKTRQAEQTRVFSFDPLTFDLDGDGIETVSFEQGVLFDHQSTGVKEGTGWVGADDGLLVRDLDGNGTIDSGRELFGDNTLKADGTKAAHGFEALSELDSNADGIFDVNDAEFENLQVWQDTNQDGISQASELKGLSQVGISSIDLSHQNINRATDGGVISDISTFTKTDGTTAEVGNLFLDREPATTEFTNDIEIPDEVLSSGFDIKGIGSVRNLAQATSLSSSLANTFNQITQDPLNSFSYTDDLVKDWAASSNFSDTLKLESLELEDGTSFKFNISAGTRENLEKIQAIESLTGNNLIQTNIEGDQLTLTYGSVTRSYSISRGQENVLSDSYFTNGWSRISNTMALDMNKLSSIYTDIVTSVRDSIYQQVVFPELVSHLDFEHNENGEVLDANFDQINSLLKQQIEVNALEGVSLLFKAKESLGSSFISSELEYSNFLSGLSANDVANINNRKIIIDGQHLILGSKGDDTVGKYYDNSLVIAGTGDDRITANGTVVYNLGDGFDSLELSSTSKILFGGGISQDNLSFSRSSDGKNLIINVDNDPTQGVEVIDFYYLKRTPTIEFSDGSIIQGDSEVFNSPIIGTDSDDHVVLSNVYDDYVETGKGNDYISYGRTNDYANDTFKYNLGDGFDTISTGSNSLAASVKNSDKVVFGEGISQKDLGFKREFNDLIINVKGDINQGLKIKSFFSKSAYYQTQLDKFEFADGSVLTKDSDVFNLAILGTDDNNNIYTSLKDDVIIAGKGDDSIYDSDRGAGYYDGGYYNSSEDKSADTIIYNLGDGFDTIFSQVSHQEARDTLAFGEGISLDSLSFTREGNELTININNDPNQGLRITNFFSSSRIKDIKLADGTVLDRNSEQINSAIIGTEDNDTIYTGISDDVIEAGKGDDTIYLNGSNNNGYLNQDTSSNVVKYNLGDGFDTLIGGANTSNTLLFGQGITQDDLSFKKDGNDLIIQVGDDITQGLKVKQYYRGSNNLAGLAFSDGTILDDSILRNIISGTDGNDTLSTQSFNDVIVGGEGNDTINTSDSSTNKNIIRYDLGDGNDIVNGYFGSIEFGEGITKEDITYIKKSEYDHDLIIQINKGETSTLTLSNYFLNNSKNYGDLKFTNDEILDLSNLTFTFEGTNDADSLYGDMYTNDIFIGNQGDDYIATNSRNQGGDLSRASTDTSEDIIKYNLGDGFDTINSVSSRFTSKTDRVVFGDGISQQDLTFNREDHNLIIKFKNDPSQGLNIKHFFTDFSKIKSFGFVNGDILDVSNEVFNFDSLGTDGSDNISLGFTGDTAIAGKGDDTVSVSSLTQNGTIKYNLGDGFDTIKYTSYTTDPTYVIEFGEGISRESLNLRRALDDLYINIDNNPEQGIRVENFYANNKNGIKSINFADGAILSTDDEVFNLKSIVLGTNGDDNLSISGDDNTIDPGAGNDDINIGSSSNSTIRYNLGDGFDTIKYFSYTSNPTYTIEFGKGIGKENLNFKRVFDDLYINIDNSPEQGIKVESFYVKSRNIIGSINFVDGTILSSNDEIFNLQSTIFGTEDDDNLSITGDGNTIDAGAGNDTINLNKSDNSTIKYNLGDGFDVISGNDQYGENDPNSKILFGEGITKENLLFSRENSDLMVFLKDDSSQGLRVKDFFVTDEELISKISRFEFADGSVLERGVDDDCFTSGNIDDSIVKSKTYNLGDGLVTFEEIFQTNFEFGDGINRSEVTFYRPKLTYDLYAIIGGDKSQGVIFKNYYSNSYSSENRGGFKFSDGTIIEGNSDFITNLTQLSYLEGTSGSDMLTSTANTQIMEGKEGFDFIVINPDSNNVTVKYNLGDGEDHIFTYGSQKHRLLLGENIKPSDILLIKEYDHLRFKINKETSGSLLLSNFF